MRYRPSSTNKPDGPAAFPPPTFRFPTFRFPVFNFPFFQRHALAARPIPERCPACVKFGYKISLKNQANRPQRPSMLRSALSIQEKSVDKSAIGRPEIRMDAAPCATAHPARTSRMAPQPSRPRLSGFRFSSGAPSPPAPIPERRPACVKFGYKISLKNQANRPQRPWC